MTMALDSTLRNVKARDWRRKEPLLGKALGPDFTHWHRSFTEMASAAQEEARVRKEQSKSSHLWVVPVESKKYWDISGYQAFEGGLGYQLLSLVGARSENYWVM